VRNQALEIGYGNSVEEAEPKEAVWKIFEVFR
jgi:hypothetical protein